jgi:hypothetical protein
MTKQESLEIIRLMAGEALNRLKLALNELANLDANTNRISDALSQNDSFIKEATQLNQQAKQHLINPQNNEKTT